MNEPLRSTGVGGCPWCDWCAIRQVKPCAFLDDWQRDEARTARTARTFDDERHERIGPFGHTRQEIEEASP